MESKKPTTKNYYSIDVAHIFKTWWQRIWLIILCAVIAAAAGFAIAKFLIEPQYSSSIMLYVNNNGNEQGGNITNSDLTASQSLVKTYGVVLNNRTTLLRVIEETGVSYTTDQLSNMISSRPANNTEIMIVTVTCRDADEAAKIANGIAHVLPERISTIITGASMEVVDPAIPNYQPVEPSVFKYTVIGFALGLILSLAFFTIIAIVDDAIHEDSYLMDTYDYPLLAKIPDLLEANDHTYYKKNYRSGSSGSEEREGR